MASDVWNLNFIHQNNPQRAYEIASSKAVLTTLIGHNVRLVPDTRINASYFIHMQHGLMDDWRTVALAFNTLNRDLKILKYNPKPEDPNYRPGTSPMAKIIEAKQLLTFEGHELRSEFMPMPCLAILCPIFR